MSADEEAATDDGLTVEVEASGAFRVLHVRGEVDLYSAPRLREQLDALIDDGATHLVVDLAGVEFLDSSGLGVLVAALKELRRRGDGDIRLARPRSHIRKIFEVTGISRVFAVHDSVDEAVA